MKEEVLYQLWARKLLPTYLIGTDGEQIKIEARGERNHFSGPDFYACKVNINGISWSGDIEMHVRSSDWYEHRHQHDHAYNKVILHVVYIHDAGPNIPTIELRSVVPEFTKNSLVQKSNKGVYCSSYLPQLDGEIIHSTIADWSEARLKRKATESMNLLKKLTGNWELLLLHMIGRVFGIPSNQDNFVSLIDRINLRILHKCHQNIQLAESLCFGLSGLSFSSNDEYALELQEQFQLLEKKYALRTMNRQHWNQMRLSPASQPAIRIATFASLISNWSSLLKVVGLSASIEELKSSIGVELSSYWKAHFDFGRKWPGNQKMTSHQLAQNLLINAIVPFMYTYGMLNGKGDYSERAVEILKSLPSEKNVQLNNFTGTGYKASDAYHSQGILELVKVQCNHGKCLFCNIGLRLIKKTEHAERTGIG